MEFIYFVNNNINNIIPPSGPHGGPRPRVLRHHLPHAHCVRDLPAKPLRHVQAAARCRVPQCVPFFKTFTFYCLKNLSHNKAWIS